MRAMVYEQYGTPDELELRDVPRPEIGADQVLIRIHAASVNRSDWESLTARPVYVRLSGAGFWKPKVRILGSDIAGVVEAVGSGVTRFQPGAAVLGDIIWHGASAFGEYVAVKENAPLARMPEGMTFEQAAAIPQGAGLAHQGLAYRRETSPGDRVLIVGAGGGAGSFAVQLAVSLGAHVTGVDRTTKLDFMQSLGADVVIDSTRPDLVKREGRYDRILDFAGALSILAGRRLLADNGIYAMVGGSMPRLLQTATVGWLISRLSDRHLGVLVAKPNSADLAYLAGLVDTGKLVPMIDRQYELGDLPEAFRYLGSGHAKGKLVITM